MKEWSQFEHKYKGILVQDYNQTTGYGILESYSRELYSTLRVKVWRVLLWSNRPYQNGEVTAKEGQTNCQI